MNTVSTQLLDTSDTTQDNNDLSTGLLPTNRFQLAQRLDVASLTEDDSFFRRLAPRTSSLCGNNVKVV